MNRFDLVSSITWPEEAQISQRTNKYRALILVQNLFYNAGIATSFCYVIAAMVLQPLLQTQTDQRTQLSAACLLKARKMVSFLESRLMGTSASVLGHNEKIDALSSKTTIERCTQTEESEHSVPDGQEASGWTRIAARLRYTCSMLDNFSDEHSDQDDQSMFLPLRFQTQSLNSCLLGLDARDNDAETATREGIKDIRDMKGWIINGKAS
ncbi:LAME_0F15896g1_1 [Lachancea meyersii CBS 8951]|uniref:LAME_0F15896g1_1 n=1 Tax=Lachancea meyersii CBS 8951 TaxID=1266667 RepID=A0A1G4JYS2_9SACH|nr:LAME_0F15896g1_1 [Lachancea meyersii CBS 8951]